MAEIGKRTPKVGMRFRDSEEAWEFWVDYGGHVGFDVRKRSTIKSRSDGVITSRWFVCSNEGHRRKNQTDHEPKRIRAETRTNCMAHMIVTYDRVAKHFEVTEVDLEHNHRLQLPQTRHLLASQRKISELQAFEIETADDSGIMPKAAHEFACRRVGGNLSYTCSDQKNHLRSKQQRELAYGQAGSMLKYFREEERMVIGDPLTKTVSCSCWMFNRTGILCAHGLKVLDLMNIKTLPAHYVLKRWTREARNESIQDREGNTVVENPKMEAELRYKDLSHKFHKIAQQAANSPQCCFLLDNALDSVAPHIHDLLNASTSAMNELCKDKENVDPNVQQVDEMLRSARLKKKEVPAKNLRRKKTWLDKLLKGKHRVTKGPTKQGEKPQKKKDGVQKKKKDGVHPQVGVEKYDNNKEVNLVLQECNNITSFTQLLTANLDNLF